MTVSPMPKRNRQIYSPYTESHERQRIHGPSHESLAGMNPRCACLSLNGMYNLMLHCRLMSRTVTAMIGYAMPEVTL